MLVCALGAGYAFVTAIPVAQDAGPETQQVETWRIFGFAFFACVFVLLAVWPRRYPGLWEVLIINKAALTVAEYVLVGQNAEGAGFAAIADLALTILLIAAYLLSRGYVSWRPDPASQHPAVTSRSLDGN
jgi:hypothetical protein